MPCLIEEDPECPDFLCSDDRLAEEVRRRAAAKGMSVSAFIARILDDSLKQREPEPQRPFRLVTVGGPGVAEGVDLDRPRSIEHGCTWVSTDADFDRFAELRWQHPLTH